MYMHMYMWHAHVHVRLSSDRGPRRAATRMELRGLSSALGFNFIRAPV